MSVETTIALEALTDGTPITYGVVQPGPEDENGVKFVRGGDVAKGRVLTDGLRTISKEVSSQYNRTLLRGGELIISLVGNPGEVAIVPSELIGANIARQVGLIRLDQKKTDAFFVKYYLMSPMGKAQLKANSLGSVQSVINLKELKRIEIPKLPLDEQKTISKILHDLDDKIELNRQINQSLEQIAQTIFKSWFVDFEPVKAKIEAKAAGRDPGRAAMCAISGKSEPELDQLPPEQYQQLAAAAALFPDALVESELGLIPAGWGAISLYDTADYVNGSAFKAADFSEDGCGLPIVKIAELKQGITGQTKFTTKVFKDKYAIKSGDILYSWSGSPETSLDVFKWFGGSGWLNQHIFKLNFSSRAQRYYAFYLLRHLRPVLVQTAMDKQTTGLGHVTVADMKRIKVVYPDKKLLNVFCEAVAPFYEQDSLCCEQIITLVTLRDSLLPKLLTGELTAGKLPLEATA